MKIILASLLYKPNIGGIENSIAYLAHEYKKKGYDVQIIASNYPSKYNLLKEEIIDDIKINRFNWNEKLVFPFTILINLISLVSYLRKFRKKNPDYVFISRHHLICIAAKICNYKNIRYLVPEIISKPTTLLKFSKENFVSYFNSWFQIAGIKCCSKIFVFSENVKKQLLELTSFDNIEIVKPGIDLEKFTKISKSQARSEIGIDKDDYVFLCIGRFIERKGYSLAIEAFSKIESTNSKLILVGEGPEKSNYVDMVNRLNLSGRVSIYDKTDKAEIFYKSSDVFLMTSFNEPFGQTILEAMASKLGVIAFENDVDKIVQTASPEILVHKGGALFCKPNLNSLSEAMSESIENGLNKSFGEFNLQEVKKYSWEILSNNLIA
jgi:glycosyltransferase involved in cell wall biosynthesis